MLAKLWRRARYLLRQSERDRLLGEEIRAHVDLHAEELIEQGWTPEAAAQAARRRFGNTAMAREEARSVWIARRVDELGQDLRYGLRSLRRQPGFTAAAVLSASLGIGACCTIFEVANFAMFHAPAGVAAPETLATIWQTNRGEAGSAFPYPELAQLRQRQRAFEAVAAMFPLVPANLGARREWGWLVTANYFDVVGARPFLGRTFGPDDDIPGAAPAIVVSHTLWRERLGGDASVVGREILFNGRKAMLIGVAPPGFRGHEAALAADFWIPLSMLDRVPYPRGGAAVLKDWGNAWLWTVGRLRPGVSIAQANAELSAIAGQFRAEQPERWKQRGLHVERAGQLHVAVRRILGVFFALLAGAALLVLLIACSNVANLLLARGWSRQREIATRLAIGAGRGRLVRQLITESLLVGLLGGAGGLAVAIAGGRLFGRLRLPLTLPIDLTMRPDLNAAAFAGALALLTGLLFGLAPALQMTLRDLGAALKPARFGLRNALIVAQVAISAVLLIASTLFLRSLTTARTMDLGMSARNVLFLQVDPASNGYTPNQARQFFATLADRLSGVPGIRAVSYTNLAPLSFVTASGLFSTEPRSAPIHAQTILIGPRYFDTLGIRLLRGRDFGFEQPGGESVLIVNEAFARKAFPGQDPIGRRLYRRNEPYRIVGLVATAKAKTIGEDPEPQVYHSFLQNIGEEEMPMGLTVAVRTDGDPAAWLPAAKEQITMLDRALPVFDVRTMETHLRGALLLPRMAAWMFGIAGGIGLLIATAGVYGIVSFAVARRTREIGLRMAMGARRGQVVGMVMRQSVGLTATGLIAGVAVAWPAMRAASSLLYGIAPSDPATFVAVPACLLAAAAAAALGPAYRAAHLDPARTLREE